MVEQILAIANMCLQRMIRGIQKSVSRRAILPNKHLLEKIAQLTSWSE